MNTITYVRLSGTPITVNDTAENRAYAAEHGWTEVKPETTKADKPARKSK